MKKRILVSAIIALTFSLQALDLETGFEIGNLGLKRDVLSDDMAAAWGLYASVSHSVNDSITIEGRAEKDPLYGFRLDSTLRFNSPYVSIALGPSLASFNNSQLQIKPALNGSFSLKKEGLIDFTASLYGTFGNLADRESDYSQSRTYLGLKLNIPGAICTFSTETRQYSRFAVNPDLTVSTTTDILSTYQLEADIFRKNIPFHVLVTLGYNNLKRIYPLNDPQSRDKASLGTLFVGVGTIVNIGPKIQLKVLLDSGLYNFSTSDAIAYTEIPVYLFRVSTSFRYRF